MQLIFLYQNSFIVFWTKIPQWTSATFVHLYLRRVLTDGHRYGLRCAQTLFKLLCFSSTLWLFLIAQEGLSLNLQVLFFLYPCWTCSSHICADKRGLHWGAALEQPSFLASPLLQPFVCLIVWQLMPQQLHMPRLQGQYGWRRVSEPPSVCIICFKSIIFAFISSELGGVRQELWEDRKQIWYATKVLLYVACALTIWLPECTKE